MGSTLVTPIDIEQRKMRLQNEANNKEGVYFQRELIRVKAELACERTFLLRFSELQQQECAQLRLKLRSFDLALENEERFGVQVILAPRKQ